MTRLFYMYVPGILLTRVFAGVPAQPFAMTWSDSNFGPDGPWQAVQISIGTPAQQVALYPGGTFRSHLLAPDICSNVTLFPKACFASAAGLYNVESSATALEGGIDSPAATDYLHGGLQIQGAPGIGALDQINIGTMDALGGPVIVPNVTIGMYNDIAAVYPSGSIIALEVGTLGLGYLGAENQSFVQTGAPTINGSLIPGYLQAAGLTPSNSFGLHIGSLTPSIKGSLHFGGYDQSRICGNISTQQGTFAGIEPDDDGKKGLIDLLDIEINVIDGASSFKTSSITNLLASGNSSIGPALSLPMLPEAPYLDLPKSSCDAITAWLPVTYNAGLGLYTWNTKDPRYTQIISSPTVLSFVFRKDQTTTHNMTINVPFILLNLTLEAPLVTNTVSYFPCNAQSNGRYSLGRAFLQAAFVGANWNFNTSQGVWWLAQAPGPNIGTQITVQAIGNQDGSISPSSNNWADTWKGVLVPLTSQPGTTTPFEPRPPESNLGLSTAAKAGIGATLAVAGLGVIALCAYLYHRRYRRRSERSLSGVSTAPAMTSNVSAVGRRLGRYRDGGYGPAELSGHQWQNGNQIGNRDVMPNNKDHGEVQPLNQLAGDPYKTYLS